MDFDKGFQTQAFSLALDLFIALFVTLFVALFVALFISLFVSLFADLVSTLAFLWLWGIIEFIIDGFKNSTAQLLWH